MDCMEFISCNDERVWGADDAQTIQNAIDLARREGLDQVLIPRRNRRTGEAVWHIGRSIVLPSSMTVIVSGAYLRAADDLPVHVFCTEPQQEELHDIRILGVGEAFIRVQTKDYCTVLLISEGISAGDARLLGFEKRPSLEQALEKAHRLMGEDAAIGIIPHGGEMLCRLTPPV